MSKVVSGKGAATLPVWELPPVTGVAAPAVVADAVPAVPSAAQIDAVRAQAYTEGFERGRRSGFDCGRSELAQRLAEIDAVLNGFARPFANLGADVERELIALAVTIARELCQRELSIHPEIVAACVRQALAALATSAGELVVYLHPDDVALVAEALADRGGDCRLVADAALGRGDSRIQGGDACVDAGLSARIDGLVATLLGADASPGAGA